MLIKIVGKRSFQVFKDEVISSAREVKDNSVRKLCYLDPTFDYDVKDAFGAEMVRRYPMDIVETGKVNTFKEEPKVTAKAPEIAAPVVEKAPEIAVPKVKRSKKG